MAASTPKLTVVTIQSDFFFNKDWEYLRHGSKGSRLALSISKMKAAYYPDVGLEQMVPDQIYTSKGDRRPVRTHMRIFSVVRIKVFSMYGYDYMKKIVLRRADLNEHIILERDFKYLYPSYFEYLYLLNLQGHLNHLPPKDKKILTTAVNLWTRHLVIRHRVEDFQLGIESYQTQLNLTKPRWDATGFEYKHDYTEYLRHGSKCSRLALSISKMKAAYYLDVSLEQMVPDQMWIDEECEYDIAAMYGISHWWFQRQRFYIDRHTSKGDHRPVRTHMRILSVVRIKVFSMYGYDYMKKIVLRRADLNEHIILERDFKYLYPSDFEDLYLLNLQGYLNHLPPKDKKILTTAINLWTRNLVI
nr:hypothetical protein [Tanacetum cinerariifolium]